MLWLFPIPVYSRLQRKFVLKLISISARRQIMWITVHSGFGINWVQLVLWRRVNSPSERLRILMHIYRKTLKSRHLSMVRCVFRIPGGAFWAIILPAVMRILVHVPIRAAGNIILWKKIVRENICRLRKTRGEHIFSIPRICVWLSTFRS